MPRGPLGFQASLMIVLRLRGCPTAVSDMLCSMANRQPRVSHALRLLVAAAALTFGSRAAANVAAPIPDPGRMGPELAATTPLVVRGERLSFECEEARGAPVCSFEARYQIENPTAEASGGRAAFYGLHTEDLVVKV